ncbi:MAG: TerD family protein [Acinetobacter bohemicus]|jgi:tellurium resistance protein TerD|uniref:TerD family protein n=2 Tax=Acinetobacter TaxID=469 RepID=A0AAE9LSR4_9GAMM|nr:MULTISPECIES: TerD family protein [Acinetobacter]MBP8027789.1 TerD family protein [Acinetobacter sp.]KAB0652812.1 TerD family protein [Acinetobacter bohemicus]USE84104.1 TerD family protein [Acinetobacter tibetensis]CAD9196122.1 Tellurium resistance protein TerE [Acinetobacter bohemicus]SFS85182.1 tellurium resistance protein TerD [Acinetobacter bohemicus]
MAINLSKGGNINLSKTAPTMNKVDLGLGWNPRATDGKAFDLDAVAFLTGEDGKVRLDGEFIFFNQKVSPCGSVTHKGDNRTGDGEGDDETISVDLSKVPQEVAKIVFAVTIHEGQQNGQNFGMVDKAYIRVINQDANAEELARFDLSEDGSTEVAMIFGELYRHNGEWKFKAVGQGFNGGLGVLAASYGVAV